MPVTEPEHYLVMKSKISRRSDRLLPAVIYPFFLSLIFMSISAILLTEITEEPYISYISTFVFFVVFVASFFILRKYYVLKDNKFDIYDRFGYDCAQIGMDLQRILEYPDYNHYLVASINSLKITNFFVYRKFKSPNEKKLHDNLKVLPKLSFNLTEIVKDSQTVEENEELIQDIKSQYMGIASFIYNKTHPLISPSLVNDLVKNLRKIQPEPWYKRIKTMKIGKLHFVIIDFIISGLTGFITYMVTGDSGTGIMAFIGMLAAIPALFFGVKNL